MLFNMAQIVKLLLIFERDVNNEPEHIITICYTEISFYIKHFMKHKTYLDAVKVRCLYGVYTCTVCHLRGYVSLSYRSNLL